MRIVTRTASRSRMPGPAPVISVTTPSTGASTPRGAAGMSRHGSWNNSTRPATSAPNGTAAHQPTRATPAASAASAVSIQGMPSGAMRGYPFSASVPGRSGRCADHAPNGGEMPPRRRPVLRAIPCVRRPFGLESGARPQPRGHPMRSSELNLTTLKEVPAEAEIPSHQLMLRAGLIRRLASGLFTWMPIGLRVVKKIEAVVREEMDRAGALELLMPAVQPAELWQESGRWDKYGPLLLRMQDRHERDFCFGPTHEEVITDIARRELRSYRQLPVNYYQIQTKFRDEIRPRFGVMRAREFIMKDAYSFDLDEAGMAAAYERMARAYEAIFTRLGLKFRAVEADSGEIGGSRSQEFHVLADSGEDAIAYCDEDGYAANVEMARTEPPAEPRPAPSATLEKVRTPAHAASRR